MNYKIHANDSQDYLMHYGVPGMKWGHRKSYSIAGTGHRALAGVYGINQKFYSKNGRNRALASMNAQARNQQLRKAAAADAAKAAKRQNAIGMKAAKKQAITNAKTSYKEAKAKSAAARKVYNKSFNKAYGFSQRHAISQYVKKSKNYQKSNDLWSDAYKKADAYNAAHKEMRAARKAYRQAKRG